MFIIGRLMGVSTVLLTTGTSGRDDLFKKFTEMLQGSKLPSPWVQGYVQPDTDFAYGVGQNTAIPQLVRAPSNLLSTTLVLRSGTVGTAAKTAWASEQLLQGACLVVNNSSAVRLDTACWSNRPSDPCKTLAQAIQGAVQLMISAQGAARVRGRSFDFLMIVDEADDFYRTQASLTDDNAKDDSAIKMDLAMRRLRDLRPLIKFEVSATLFAIYLSLAEMGKAARIPAGDIFYIESSSEYVGSDLLIPLEDANGKPIFLDQGELCVKNIFINDKVCKLWDDAMKEVPLPPDARALSWI